MPSVFISYSRVDTAFVRRLHDALKAAQYDIWVDWEDIPPSATWTDEIRTGVTGADAFVYVISPDSVASEVCGRELGWAVERNKRIVPVVHREPDGAKVPEAAAALNWVFLRDSDDFDAGVATLTSAVETDLDHVRTHTRLGVAAGRWNESGRDRSQLLRGQELAAAEAWLVGGAGLKPEPTQLQREYVLASRQSATRRQRTVIGAVTFGLAVAIVLAIVALIQRSSAIHERNVAQAQALDATAQKNDTIDPEASVVYARRAAQIVPGSSTEATLRASLAQSMMRVRYSLDQPSETEAGDAVWNPQGTRLLVTNPGVSAVIETPGSNVAPVKLAGAPSVAGESAWDAAGDRIILGGHDSGVYDAQTGALIRRLELADQPVESIGVALTPDGSEAIAVQSLTGTGYVFEVATGALLATFHPHLTGGVTCFALSPTGSVAAQCDAASTTNDNSAAALDLWSVASGRLLRSIPSPSLIKSVAFNPTGSLFIYANSGVPIPTGSAQPRTQAALRRLELADANVPSTFVYSTSDLSGPPVVAFPGGAASAVAFGPVPSVEPNAEQLAYAQLNPTEIHVYELGNRKTTTLIGPTDNVETLAFSRSGQFLAAGSDDHETRVYSVVYGGDPVETLAGDTGDVDSVSFGAGDRSIATASADGTTRVWAGPVPSPSLTVPAVGSPPASVGFSSDGRLVLDTSTTGNGEVLSADDLHPLSRFSAGTGLGFAGALISGNDRVVIAVAGPFDAATRRATGDQAVAYNASTGAVLARMPTTPNGPIIAAVDRAGTALVTIGASGAAEEWDPLTGRLVHTLSGSSGIPGAIAFSRAGSEVAIVHYPYPEPATLSVETKFGKPHVDLFSVGSGRLIRTIATDNIESTQIPGELPFAPLGAAFSPDGATLAVAGGNDYIELYNTATGAPLSHFLQTTGTPVGSYVTSLAYSPNGEYLAAGSNAGALVWRLPEYQGLGVFQSVPSGEQSFIAGDGAGVAVSFTADSSTLITQVTGYLDTVQAWALNGLQLGSIPTSRGTLNPQGTQFVAANDAAVSLYPCDLCGDLSHLTALASRRITYSPSFQAQLLRSVGG